MKHRLLSPIIALSLFACVEDPADLDEETQEVSGSRWNRLVPGMVRFRTTDSHGQNRWVTGLLVAPSGQTSGPFSSRIVLTSSTLFLPRWINQCIPQTTVEHGWVHTNTPMENDVTTARVVDHLGHFNLPITALVLAEPLSAARTFAPSSSLPAFSPGTDNLRCFGYNSSGNLNYTWGRALATSAYGYLHDATGGGAHRLNGRDAGFVCVDPEISRWFGVNSHEWWTETTNNRDIDGDGRSDTIESRDACAAENSNQLTGGRCLTSHVGTAPLAAWIDAQHRVVNLVNPTQFTTRLWFESAANPVCIDIPSESFADVNVNQWSCHRRSNQRFFEIPAGNGVAFVNANSGKCWAASGNGVVQRTCNTADVMQRWSATPTASPAPAGRVLRNLGTNTCVTAQGSAISVQVRLTACPTTTGAQAAQVWKTNHPGPGLPWCVP
jgi:hypothetical protein